MPAPTGHPPQTLRQAKKAYKSAGAIPRISEAEKRRLQRSAELQQRADRLKEREKQKRETQRKKTEKELREKEERRRRGIPDKDEGYISPRQVRIGVFLGRGDHARCGAKGQGSDHETELKTMGMATVQQQASPTTRRPLQRVASNPKSKNTSPEEALSKKRSFSHIEEDWTAMFPSNTQLERELSVEEAVLNPTPPTPPPPPPTTLPSPHPHANANANAVLTDADTDNLLATICTQDFASSLPSTPSSFDGFDSADKDAALPTIPAQDLEFTDDELDDLTADFMPTSPALTATATTTTITQKVLKGHTARYSTFEAGLCCQAPPSKGPSCEVDEFPFPTQELRDLVP
ncbi:hypothetical protein MMC24_006697 [Lignoscripta atroalba]|nr:hypothetical protein [Lignoscripta atroalba]